MFRDLRDIKCNVNLRSLNKVYGDGEGCLMPNYVCHVEVDFGNQFDSTEHELPWFPFVVIPGKLRDSLFWSSIRENRLELTEVFSISEVSLAFLL